MSDEKKIRGIIQAWSTPEATSNGKFFVQCKINNNQYRFFLDTFEDAESWKSDKPLGSVVEFDQSRFGNYWNYKKGTWNTITVGDGKPPQVGQPQSQSRNTSPSDWKKQNSDMSKEDWLEKEQRDIRIRCLDVAAKVPDVKTSNILNLAKTLESYVWEGYDMPVKQAGSQSQQEPIPVENI